MRGVLFLIFYALFFNYAAKNMMLSRSAALQIMFESIACTTVILLAYLWLTYNLQVIILGRFTILITPEGIRKSIDMEDAYDLHGLKKILFKKIKRISSRYEIFMGWKSVKTLIEKNNGLLLKPIHSNNPFQKRIIFIPRQITMYDELKQIIQTHLSELH